MVIIIVLIGITNLVNESLQLFAVDLAIAIGIKQLEGLVNAVMKMFAIERRDGIDQDDETDIVKVKETNMVGVMNIHLLQFLLADITHSSD